MLLSTTYEQLDKIHNKSHRNALVARLLTSSHRLRVETGRWGRPVIPYESRICTMCHKLDDEFHFLLECPRYHDMRRQYLPTYFRVRPSVFKCIELLNTNNDKTVRSLAKYVFEAFRVRSLSVSWYVHVLCVMHWLRRGAVAVAIAGRWLHPWMSWRHSRLQTVTSGDRVWSVRPPPSPSVPSLNSVFCVICHHVGLLQLFCHVCEYHEVGIVKWTLVRACGLRSGK